MQIISGSISILKTVIMLLPFIIFLFIFKKLHFIWQTKYTPIPSRFDRFDCNSRSCLLKDKKQRYPSFLIIGDRKSGTSALRHFLYNLHPELVPSINKGIWEPHFFDHKFIFGYNYYLTQFRNICDCQVSFEKTPNYFMNEGAPGRVLHFEHNFPQFYGDHPLKFILILRDPIQRELSDFKQETRRGSINMSLENYLFHNGKPSFIYYWPSRYYVYLKNWMQYFPLERILILDGDNFIMNPVHELLKIEKFLNLEPLINQQQDDIKRNPETGFYCVSDLCLPKEKGHHHDRSELSEDQWTLLYRVQKTWNSKFCDLAKIQFKWCSP